MSSFLPSYISSLFGEASKAAKNPDVAEKPAELESPEPHTETMGPLLLQPELEIVLPGNSEICSTSSEISTAITEGAVSRRSSILETEDTATPAAEPVAIEPVVTEPERVEPDMAESEMVEPDMAESEMVEPDMAESEKVESEAITEPVPDDVTEPVTEPEPAPLVLQPEYTTVAELPIVPIANVDEIHPDPAAAHAADEDALESEQQTRLSHEYRESTAELREAIGASCDAELYKLQLLEKIDRQLAALIAVREKLLTSRKDVAECMPRLRELELLARLSEHSKDEL